MAVGCGLFTAASFPLARDTTGEIYDPGLHWVDGLLFFGGSTLAFLVLSRRLAADPRWRSLSAYTLAIVVLSFGSTMALHLLARPTYAPLHDYGAWYSGQSSWC
ncbi:hypothetical protein [Streptomyces sp. TRM68367]|uniref:hypothetical protein n=1 Tax=Streptomyces sp. TRM68367 TaxID=2758415 RepID=UPI001CA863AA|nr:hypothetical protein [Streptomyces sp. TRM68367]